jgi:glycosyl transferase family 25
VEECNTKYADIPFIANFEESSLLFVPRSQRRKGVYLYPAQRDRYAGCYYINRLSAQAILEYVASERSDTTSDLLHSKLIKEGKLNYFWSYPCLACQCSCDGSMPTMIPTRPRPLKRLKWFYKRFYKHLLYFLR